MTQEQMLNQIEFMTKLLEEANQTKPGFVEKRMKQFTDRLEQLKTELKEWEDMVPVNNMGKWGRQTKIDSIKKQIELLSEDYRVISNEDADEDFRYSQINVKTENK
jgi:DNA polymerase II small subunit/DNA polymerase delta subunit B